MQLGVLIEKLAADVPGQQERQSVNITELICSQENAPGTHKSPQKIEQITGIARSSVVMLIDFFATVKQTRPSRRLFTALRAIK